MKILQKLLILFLVGATAGCSLLRQRTDTQQSAYVQVMNNNWADVNVFAVRGDQRVRLGTVGTLTTKRLRIPGNLLTGSALQLAVDPIGATTGYSSEYVTVWPGETLSLTVENQLTLSRIIPLSK